MAESLYELLEVSEAASAEEIKQNYRKLLLRYHPDKIQQRQESDEQDKSRFELIQMAWQVLSDEEKRREYDEERRRVQKIAASAEEVALSEFEEDREGGVWRKACRCGEEFLVSSKPPPPSPSIPSFLLIFLYR